MPINAALTAPLLAEDVVRRLDHMPVLVKTHGGTPVSLGKVLVSQAANTSALRVEIRFETDRMTCAIGVSWVRMVELLDSFDGKEYAYRLPEGDAVWLPHPWEKPTLGPRQLLVETFPLPHDAVLAASCDAAARDPRHEPIEAGLSTE